MEGRSFTVAIHEANKSRGSHSLALYVRESRAPEIPVILLEDFGALIGLVFGLFGVTMTLVTNDGRWDAVGAAAIGVLLVVIAVFLAREMASMLIGESAEPAFHQAIEAAIPGEGVDGVIHMKTLHLGPDSVLVAAKIAVHTGESAAEIARAIDDAEGRIRAAVPLRTVIYLEPDLRRHATPEPTAPDTGEPH